MGDEPPREHRDSSLPDNGAIIGSVLGVVLGYFCSELEVPPVIIFGTGCVVTVFTFVHDSIGISGLYADIEHIILPTKSFVASTIGGIFVGKGLKKTMA